MDAEAGGGGSGRRIPGRVNIKEEAGCTNSQNVGENALQIVVEDDPGLIQSIEGAEIEMVEQDTVGQIVQGEDGEYYVVVEDGAPDVELDHLNNIQVLVNEDGTETLVLENDQSLSRTIDVPQRSIRDSLEASQDLVGSESRIRMAGGAIRRGRTVLAETEDGGFEMVQLVEDEDGMDVDAQPDQMGLGAMATAESGGDMMGIGLLEPIPQGMKMRRNRVFGTCRCPECGQSFVNTARLERHLAVHQVFGSFLCPLCGKTYKYEYNLFYHWRRTCRDLNELMPIEERKTMDVNALRQLVDEVAQKKAEIGPIEIGINRNVLYATSHLARLEMPTNTLGRRGNTCRACGVVVLAAHMPRHLAIHRGEATVDDRGVCGGFYCDLCGLMFRQHFNLIKHWRTGCPEIQANLPEDQDIILDDEGLKRMVMKLMKRSVTQEIVDESIKQAEAANREMQRVMNESQQVGDADRLQTIQNKKLNGETSENAADIVGQGRRRVGNSYVEQDGSRRVLDENGDSMDGLDGEFSRGDMNIQRNSVEQDEEAMNERWADEQGLVFADDFMDDEEALVIGEDGTLGPLAMSSTQNRAKWSMSGGPVQCPECFRSFANSGRLERHLAGFHASFGSHHCILCGNRFKYDYNLLYHYRRSCPYTKAFIDRDIREQMDAMNLRKLVRTLSQKDLQLAPLTVPQMRLLRRDPADILGSRRQMLRYPVNPVSQPPPHLLVPRPGLHDGKSCPVCSVIFYGNGAVDRHMKAAHPVEWEEWNLHNAPGIHYDEQGRRILLQDGLEEAGDLEAFEVEEETEPPPTLTAEPPGEQPLPPPPPPPPPPQPTIRRAHHIEEDEHGNQRLVDENGVVIEAAEGEEIHVQMDDLGDVQRLIDSGQLQVQHGDQIILVQENEMGGYGEGLQEAQVVQATGEGTYEERGRYDDNEVVIERGYSEPQADESLVERKEGKLRKASDKSRDDGLEVAAILTEMKTNDPQESAECAEGTVVASTAGNIQHFQESDFDQEVGDDAAASTSGEASFTGEGDSLRKTRSQVSRVAVKNEREDFVDRVTVRSVAFSGSDDFAVERGSVRFAREVIKRSRAVMESAAGGSPNDYSSRENQSETSWKIRRIS